MEFLLIQKKIHFDALNLALKKVNATEISFKDHLNIFDGLPTNKKLSILNDKKILNKKFNSKVIKIKQEYTLKLLNKFNNY